MIIFGFDAHKRTHTIVAADETGRRLAAITIGTSSDAHLAALRWARGRGEERLWAIEDCRHLSRRLERDLLAAGEQAVRVPPKLMAGARRSARKFGTSDPIDALAVARAAIREPDLPIARLDGTDRELRMLVDHREALVAERTRTICRLRWRLHELDPALDPTARSLDRPRNLTRLSERIADLEGLVARLARSDIERCGHLTAEINNLEKEITDLVAR
jgi:transposase